MPRETCKQCGETWQTGQCTSQDNGVSEFGGEYCPACGTLALMWWVDPIDGHIHTTHGRPVKVHATAEEVQAADGDYQALIEREGIEPWVVWI